MKSEIFYKHLSELLDDLGDMGDGVKLSHSDVLNILIYGEEFNYGKEPQYQINAAKGIHADKDTEL